VNLNREELAWAAGFYDGEGCTSVCDLNSTRLTPKGKPKDKPRLRMSIAQSYSPETLERFQRAVLGLGSIRGPWVPKSVWTVGEKWEWTARRAHEVIGVVGLLWPFLCTPKREQIVKAMTTCKPYLSNRHPHWVPA
jgi:hypothetical protein